MAPHDYFMAHRIVKALQNKEKTLHDAAGFSDGLMIQKVLHAARESDRLRSWVKILP